MIGLLLKNVVLHGFVICCAFAVSHSKFACARQELSLTRLAHRSYHRLLSNHTVLP